MKLIGVCGLFFIFSCISNQSFEEHNFPYQFDKPELAIDLDKDLNEISGLCFTSDSNLLAINDEQGIVYSFQSPEFKSQQWIDFKKKGDFEGIANLNDLVYVLKSDGDIYEVQSNGSFEQYESFKKGYDFEGLCLNRDSTTLLLACKKHRDKKKDEWVWIYEFDLKQKKLKKEVYCKINKADLYPFFRPSGIAINNLGEIFLISATANALIEIDEEGKLLRSVQFPELQFPQMEGICFDSNNGLYLASERDYLDRAKLYYFARQNE